jgi:hypothetical protein
MPSFDAGKVISSLEWDFTTIPDWPKNGPLAKAHGIIKEPSDKMIGDFLDGMKNLYKDAKGFGVELPEDADPMAIMAALDTVTGDDFVKLMDTLAGMYAVLCNGKPTKEMILALPLRARTPFFEWMVSEVVRPEAGNGGGAQVVNLPQREATG